MRVVLRIEVKSDVDRNFDIYEITGHPTLHWVTLGFPWQQQHPLLGWTNQPTYKRRLEVVGESRDVEVDGRGYNLVRSGEGQFRIVKVDLEGRFRFLDYVDETFLCTFKYGHRPWITVTGRALRHEVVEVLAS